ncbi:hypothetical protein EDD22DRAFT_950645 [Suillus occidentalis]|nr:hypothetical protein EDD22DRAFT_950645 [Suillus occidentalis]
MPIPLFQGFGKVIAFRLKRPEQKGRTQHNSTTTNHEGVSSIPANISNPVSALTPSSIPSLVPPVSAIRQSGLETSTAKLLTWLRMLQGTSARVAMLHERRLASTPVMQAIAGCFMDIARYLADYLVLFHSRRVFEKFMILQRQIEDQNKLLITNQSLMIRPQSFMGPSTSPGVVVFGCVTLVDATGHHHDIPVNFCTSYQRLNDMLRVLFQRESDAIDAQIQRRYIEKGEYDLCIDEGMQVTLLTSHEWSSIEAGTKIVMRVTIEQETL